MINMSIYDKFKTIELPYIFKNLRKVAEFLEEEYKANTDSRKRIIKILEQYCEYINDGHKYIITKIHTEPQEKEDNRKFNGAESKYSEMIDDLMLMLLTCHNVQEKKNFFYNEFKMFWVENYYEHQNQVDTIAKDVDAPLWIVDDYFLRVGGFMNNILKASINRLIKNESIEFRKIMMCYDNTDEDKKPREMIIFEMEQYEAIKESVAKQLGLYNKVIPPSVSISYWTKVKEETKKLMDLSSIWTIWDITQGEKWYDHVPFYRHSDPEMWDKRYNKIKNELNQTICESIVGNCKNRVAKAIELNGKYADDFGFSKEDKNAEKYLKNKSKYDSLVKYGDIYIKVYEELTADLIKSYDDVEDEVYYNIPNCMPF
jgi:hypothetical protein